MSRSWFRAGCAAEVAAALAVVFLLCRHGAGMTGDTLDYYGCARDLRLDHLPLSHAPLYAIVLGLCAGPAGGVERAAVGLNAVLFAASLGLLLWNARRAWGMSRGVALAAGACVGLSAPVLGSYAFAISETLFFPLLYLWLGCLAAYAGGAVPRPRWLVAAGLTAFLAFFTRYAGVALLGIGGFVVLVRRRREARALGRDLALYLATGALPMAGWLVFNTVVRGTATGRGWVPNPLTAHKAGQGVATLLEWVLPYRVFAGAGLAARGALLAVLAAGLAAAIWRTWPAGRRAYGVLVPFAVFYPAFIVFSLVFGDYMIPLDNRILAPLAAVLVPLVALAAQHAAAGPSARPLRRGLAAGLCAYFLLFYGWRASGLARASYTLGNGLNQVAWQRSEALRVIRALARTRRIYTNAPDVVTVNTAVTNAGWIPFTSVMVSGRPNPLYGEQMARLRAEAAADRAVIVICWGKHPTEKDFPHFLPRLDAVRREAGVEDLARLADGLVLGVPSEPLRRDLAAARAGGVP